MGGPTLSVTMTLIFPKIVWTCPLISTVIWKYIICELLHVLIIRLNPKGIEVHPTQGHTTIFELALLIGNCLFHVIRVSIYPNSFVYLLICSFIPSLISIIF